MNTVTKCLIGTGLSLLSTLLLAQSDQFYFLASPAPLSVDGQSRAIFLRWDEVEEALPADVTEFVLYRRHGSPVKQTDELLQVPVVGHRDASQINDFYAEPGQQLRAAEMLAWLRGVNPALPPAGLGQAVSDRLDNDSLWAMLASRIDINVARARGRAYVDRDYPADFPLEYELVAKTLSGDRRLGLVSLGSDVTAVAPAPRNLRQVLEARCDAPEESLDHGSVALSWEVGGADAQEQFAAGLSVAGYDIYRSIANTTIAASFGEQELAQSPRLRGFDARGQRVFEGLEKVNDQPVTLAGDGGDASFVAFRETLPELQRRNVYPGDVRDYYLVARDFAGHYGATARLKVIVPDLRAPQAPWNVELRQNQKANQMQFRWDAVNVPNYISAFGGTRKLCNADSARSTGRLLYVEADEICGQDAAIEVNLNADGYLVYRFDRYDQAVAFTDSDGDGFSDRDERQAVPVCSSDPEDTVHRAYGPKNPEDFRCTDVGTACNPAAAPSNGAPNFLLTRGFALPPHFLDPASDRRQMAYEDPLGEPGRVFWYRFASYRGSGAQRRVSILTPPLRAKFNDYAQPKRSALDLAIQQVVPNEACLDYVTAPIPTTTPGQVAVDRTQDARHVVLDCLAAEAAPTDDSRSGVLSMALAGDSVILNADQCAVLARQCQPTSVNLEQEELSGPPYSLAVRFFNAQGLQLGQEQRISGNDWATCQLGAQAELTQTGALRPTQCPNQGMREPDPGEVLPKPPVSRVRLGQGACLSLYRDLNGASYRVAMQCGPYDGILKPDLPGMRQGEMLCLSVALHDSNNRVSAKGALGCHQILDPATPKPRPPQWLSMSLAASQISLTWRRPQQRTSATILEVFEGNDLLAGPLVVRLLSHGDGGVDAPADFAGVGVSAKADHRDGQGASAIPQTVTLDIPPGDGGERTLCARLRSVGVGAWEDVSNAVSDYSPVKCETWVPEAQPRPDYMAWPQTRIPPRNADLLATQFGAGASPMVLLSGGLLDADGQCESDFAIHESRCGPLPLSTSDGQPTQTHQGTAPTFCAETLSRSCPDAGLKNALNNVCDPLRDSLRGKLGFVVYRQSRSADGAQPEDYYQVSPLIDQLFCESKLENGQYVSQTADPFLVPVGSQLGGRGFFMGYSDEYPVIVGRQYRYQLVYFDAVGEINEVRATNWITVE